MKTILLRPLRLFTVCGLAFCLVLTASLAVRANDDLLFDGVPLPRDAMPISGQQLGFEGLWAGAWDGFLRTMLVVEALDLDALGNGTAQVIYAIASNPNRGFERAWFRLPAAITGDIMTVRGEGFHLTFKLSKSGRLQATFGDGFSFAVLGKQKLPADLKAAEISWNAGEQIMLQTKLVEDGKAVELETVLYHPVGKGPFPLAIVNHGSTGAGTNPSAFSQTWTNAWFADVLNARGWLVAFPQRRGRGGSDGTYDEGFAVDRSQGYTCKAARTLIGAERALRDVEAAVTALRKRPDVSDAPILLAGNSRGGILSVAYAGLHPDHSVAAINFVGGWLGEQCKTASLVNENIFRMGADADRPSLWLYGRDDVFYSIDHSQKNFNAFLKAGGSGKYFEFTVRGQNNGHWVMAIPPLWEDVVVDWLDELSPAQ